MKCLLTLLVLCSTVSSEAKAAPPKSGDLKLTPMPWKTASGKEVAAEMGALQVPENRAKKDRRLIEIAFLRIKHPGKKPGPPTMLLAGGPGGSGIRMAKWLLTAGADRMLDYFGGDIIGIDQRGTGASKPNLRSRARYQYPLDQPGDPKKMMAIAREVCRKEAEAWKSKGVDLTGYNTAENADDINAIRKALAYPKMNLWGGSYGSHLAFAIIRRHDRHLNRVVVQSPEGPNHTWKLPSQIQEGLELTTKLMATDPAIKDKLPDPLGSLKKILERLDKQPKIVKLKQQLSGRTIQIGVSKFDVQRIIANAIGRVRTMRSVPSMIYSMEKDDFTEVARYLQTSRTFAGPGSAMSMMMDAASGATPERLSKMKREAKEHLLGDAINFPFPEVCSAWGSPDLGNGFRGPLKSKVHILFVCGNLDSRTPIRNAIELMKDLPNSRMIEVKNGAHDFNILSHTRLREAAGRFLKGQPVKVKEAELPRPKFNPIGKDSKEGTGG